MPSNRITRSYTEVAKYVRNRLRSYSIESIVACALQSLHSFCGKGLEELRSAPWLSALIVKIALEDKQTPIRSKHQCPTALFDRLRQLLWEVPLISERVDAQGAHLALRAMLHTQLQFQVKESWSFLRWPALINTLPEAHATRRQFEARLGMSPSAFIALCWACYTALLNGKLVIRRDYFVRLRRLYGSAIDTYLTAFSRDLQQLRDELRTEFDQRYQSMRSKGREFSRDTIEVTEFPWIQRYPLLRSAPDDFVVWHPLIFARGMEQATHQVLSSLGQEYTDNFSKVFEHYVLELIDVTNLGYIDEKTFKKMHKRNSPAVEAIIEFPGGDVLIEAKMSLFPDQVVASDSRDVVFQKLRRIREAIIQGWRVSWLRALDPEIDATKRRNFLVVVTSRQLNVCNGVHMERLFGANVFADILPEADFGAPSELQHSLLPPKNMFFLSVEEFEHLSGCLRQKEVELWSILETAAAKQADPTSSVYHFDQLLGEHTKRWTLPDIQVRARDEVEAQLLQLLESKT